MESIGCIRAPLRQGGLDGEIRALDESEAGKRKVSQGHDGGFRNFSGRHRGWPADLFKVWAKVESCNQARPLL